MRYVKWTLITLLVLLVGSFLHYTLPQNDIVRIVNTENRRIDFGENAWFWASPDVGTAAGATRDVFFIQTVRANGRPMVYRNEDTGWGWPPYFKLNSHNVQTLASNLISPVDAPKWVAVTHYGWRNEFFTIFPNAIAVRQVEGPDTRIIPWVSIAILVTLGLLALLFWRMLAQFRERTIEPVLDRVDARAEIARSRAQGVRGRIRAWLDTWRGKPRR